jgi:tetratricopeptide (TPR) repeat protein
VRTLAGLLLTGALLAHAQSAREPLAQANAALQTGEADRALALLNGNGSAQASNLRCRVFYTLQKWDRAVGECEQAVKLDGQNSANHMWLARSLGEKASRASFLSAYGLGKRVRSEFEEAARHDPRNAEALADLGEFYYSAPAVVGGGMDKAEGIAAQLDKFDTMRAHQLRARIAEERKDLGTAERELKQALAANSHPAFGWTELAGFYRRHQRWDEMESALHNADSAAQRDKRAGVAFYDGAAVLIRCKRDPALAVKMLEEYLASSSKTEEAPAFEAHTRLARLKDQFGDTAAANRERAATSALAHEYKPAQDGKH